MLALVGPTAVGKSALAHRVGQILGAEIVVADPFQRYRGLEIAADAPSRRERDELRYHFVGDLDLDERSSVGDYVRRARRVIDDAVAAERPVLVSGGTGLYLQAALTNVTFPPPPDPKLAAQAESDVARDREAAVRDLHTRDPEAAARIDRGNPRRVARALALARAGQPVPRPGAIWAALPRHETRVVMLTRPREVLDARIAARVRRELDDGLERELEAALDHPGLRREPGQIIGAREVRARRQGGLSASELERELCVRTRRLARKQATWLAKMSVDRVIDLGDGDSLDAAEEVLDALTRGSSSLGR